jgi:hypothetical protein
MVGGFSMIGSRLLVMTLAGLIVTGCGNDLYLADFNDDPVNVPPPAEPPGWPYGDRTYIPSLGLSNPPDPPVVMVVPSSLFSSNAARYRNWPYQDEFGGVTFIGREPPAPVDEYWVVWGGNVVGDDSLQLTFSLDKRPIAQFWITWEHEVRLVTSTDPHSGPSFEPSLGKLLGRHVAVFHFVVATKQYELTIIQGSAPSAWLKSGMRPSTLAPLDDLGETPSLDLIYPNPSGEDDFYNGTDGYYIDGLKITGACPTKQTTEGPKYGCLEGWY